MLFVCVLAVGFSLRDGTLTTISPQVPALVPRPDRDRKSTCFCWLLVLTRTIQGNARLYGLQRDLNLTNQQFQWCLTIFFFPCACLQTS